MVYESEHEGGYFGHHTESWNGEQGRVTMPAPNSDDDAIIQCAKAADELADQFAQHERQLNADFNNEPAEDEAADDLSPDLD